MTAVAASPGSAASRLRPYAAFAIPALLAVLSVAPALWVRPELAIDAYRSRGVESHDFDYWARPTDLGRTAFAERIDDETLALLLTESTRLMGAGFAGDQWTFSFEYTHFADGVGGDAIFAFVGDAEADDYNRRLQGVRLMVRRDADGLVTAEDVIAVGLAPPYAVLPFPIGRHRIEVESSWSDTTIRVDGRSAWRGNPGWDGYDAIYPALDLTGGRHRVSIVPSIEVAFTDVPGANKAAFQRAFISRYLSAMPGAPAPPDDARFSLDNLADGMIAAALVLAHRRDPDQALADRLDRWAAWRAATPDQSAAWPGPSGSTSLGDNVGAPGLALALWGRDRGREDWLTVVRNKVAAAGFNRCDGTGLCGLGNLQPDGTVRRSTTTSRDAGRLQLAETAAFVAGAAMDDRRSWIRSLPGRAFTDQPCLLRPTLGGSPDVDGSWSVQARSASPTALLLIGLSFSELPGDPVWTEPAVAGFLQCAINLLQVQIGGPIGWNPGGEPLTFMIGGQDVAASRLLDALTSEAISESRFDVEWRRLIDPGTLSLRGSLRLSGPPADRLLAFIAFTLELTER